MTENRDFLPLRKADIWNRALLSRYEHEYSSYSHTLGNTMVFGGCWTLCIPKGSGGSNAYFGETHVHTSWSLDARLRVDRSKDWLSGFLKQGGGEAFS